MNVVIRRPRPEDAAQLNALYNYFSRETAISFDVAPWTHEMRANWLSEFADTGRYQLYMAEREGRLVGYACSRRFREKAAYETSVEASVYVDPGAQRCGVGRALYSALFAGLRGEDIRRVIAGITLPNEASVALHQRFGFEQVGVLTEVGRKFGRYWDVAWYEKRFG